MFTYHNKMTAPVQSVPFIDSAESMFGFVPNLHKILAESPAAHEAYFVTYKLATEKTNLTHIEVQVVLMASNYHNSCHYCMAGHSMIMKMINAPQDVITALREGKPINDAKLEALRTFARQLLEMRGHVGDPALEAFLRAGYTKSQALDVLVCLSAKLISNFTNALAHTEIDAPMKPLAWTPQVA